MMASWLCFSGAEKSVLLCLQILFHNYYKPVYQHFRKRSSESVD